MTHVDLVAKSPIARSRLAAEGNRLDMNDRQHPNDPARATTDTGGSITDIDGVRVGLFTDPVASTGCAVVVFDRPNTAAAEIRGAAPGTREYGLLQPGMTVESVDAIVLTGGSGFGLASADGVMRALRRDGRGFPTQFGRVPIVPAAVVFDLGVGSADAAPTADDGAAAYSSANDGPVPNGSVGPGTGCTIAKWRGAPQPGGLGNATRTIGGVTVSAMAVVNATGDLFGADGTPLTGGPHQPVAPAPMAYAENTTLVLLATNAEISRVELSRLIVRGHDAMAACIRPAHTRYDGDICFAVAIPTPSESSESSGPVNVDAAGEAAFAAVSDAIAAAVTTAR